MKNKLWPYSIVLVFILFGTFIISFVVRSMKTEVQLVRPDYYDHEINYQNQITNEVNSLKLSSGFNIKFDSLKLILNISIPDSINITNGAVHFYRPSDKKLDFEQELKNYPEQIINLNSIRKGLWEVQIFFESTGGRKYYKEQQIYIQ